MGEQRVWGVHVLAHGKNKETCRQATIKQDFRNGIEQGAGVPGDARERAQGAGM